MASETETARDWCVECPHCFHKHRDTCDYDHDEHKHEADCESCGHPFIYWTETRTVYHADKLQEPPHA